MPYNAEQIKQNWAQLRQAIVNQGIDMRAAAASDHNPSLTQLQFLLRQFFIHLMKNKHGEIVYAGDGVDGKQPDLVDFEYGARINNRHFTNKKAFLDYQAKNYTWAEDVFLSAGFDGLGIQPIYQFKGARKSDPQIPFIIAQAVSVARLTCINNGHWVRDGHQNDGAGNCGLYSASQEVAAIWPKISAWLDHGPSPFMSTSKALGGLRTKAQELVDSKQDYQQLVLQLQAYPFLRLFKLYMQLATKQSRNKHEQEMTTSLINAVMIERPDAQGMPAPIQTAMRTLVAPFLATPNAEVKLPADCSLETQDTLRPHLINILALHLQQDVATAENVLAATATKKPVIYSTTATPIANAPAQTRVDTSMALLERYQKSGGWELEALQLVYQSAADLYHFAYDSTLNDQQKIIHALAEESRHNLNLFKNMEFFLTDVNPSEPKTLVLR